MTLTYSPDANLRTMPSHPARRGPQTAASQTRGDTQAPFAGGADIPDANHCAEPIPVPRPGVDTAVPSAAWTATPIGVPPAGLLWDPALHIAAIVLDDAERMHRANANRLRVLTTPRDKPDASGKGYGFGLTFDNEDVIRLAALVQNMKRTEEEATKNLQRALRKHPLGAWVRSQPGIGEKQAARLLGAVRDPYWHTKYGRPRKLYELWAYCGLKPDQKLRRGIQANWSTEAKTRAHLIAEKVVIQNGVPDSLGRPRALSPYRAVYDNRRAHTAITHPEWTPIHSHNDALHIVSKEILKDLWLTSRDLYQATLGTEVAA